MSKNNPNADEVALVTVDDGHLFYALEKRRSDYVVNSLKEVAIAKPLRSAITDYIERTGYCVIRGAYFDGRNELLLRFLSLLGQPTSYFGQPMVTDVQARLTESTRLHESSADIPMHTDKAFVATPPHYVCLLCLEPDPVGGTSLLCDLRVSLTHLSDEHRATVETERIRFIAPKHIQMSGGGVNTPLVTSGRLNRIMRFRPDLVSEVASDQMKTTLSALANIIDQLTFAVALQKNDLLIIDNHVVAHGRTSISENSKRHLKRVYLDQLD